MFAQQSFERPEAQHFDTGDIYLPDLTDLDASALSAEALQVCRAESQKARQREYQVVPRAIADRLLSQSWDLNAMWL